MSIYKARDNLISMYNGAYLATHIHKADAERKLFNSKFRKTKSDKYVTCIRSINCACTVAYRRNRMRTYDQWINDRDWDDSPYVKPEPFKPNKATYLYSKGRLGARSDGA